MAAEEIKEDEKPKKKGKLKYIILLVLLLGMGGGGYFAYTKFFAKKGGESATQNATKPEEKPQGKVESHMVTLPTFQVNLNDPSGKRFLKLTMDAELPSKKAVDTLNANMSRVKDRLILLLSSKTFTDLQSYESKMLLKDEIIERLNQILGGPKVIQIYFTDLVIM